MTISTMLSHVGISVPRYVTVHGQIVLDPSPTAGSSPMALEPHHFHGGHDPAPSRADSHGAWWKVSQEARAADEASMKLHFPDFTQWGDDDQYAYGGYLNTGRGRFGILVFPQANHSLPSIVPLNRNLGRPAGRRQLSLPDHVYLNGNLCIAELGDWHPDRHTTATAVGWSAHWFAAYTEWRMSGRWPTRGFDVAA